MMYVIGLIGKVCAEIAEVTRLIASMCQQDCHCLFTQGILEENNGVKLQIARTGDPVRDSTDMVNYLFHRHVTTHSRNAQDACHRYEVQRALPVGCHHRLPYFSMSYAYRQNSDEMSRFQDVCDSEIGVLLE